MAKLLREIKNDVRLNGESYGPGREEDLLPLLSPQQITRLTDKGAIEGDWGIGESASSAPTLDAKLLKLLEDNFDGARAVRDASDEQLLAVNGIGPASLPKIRDYFAAIAE